MKTKIWLNEIENTSDKCMHCICFVWRHFEFLLREFKIKYTATFHIKYVHMSLAVDKIEQHSTVRCISIDDSLVEYVISVLQKKCSWQHRISVGKTIFSSVVEIKWQKRMRSIRLYCLRSFGKNKKKTLSLSHRHLNISIEW